MAGQTDTTTWDGFGWGIWATGAIAAQFAADLDHVSGARRAAVCSRSMESAQAFAAAHGFAAAHADPDAFLADPSVDAVYIASPHTEHCDQALRAIAAGKPVLIEKPVAMTSDEARAIEEAAQTAGVFAMEALWTRFLPAVQRAKALIDDGVIGPVRRAEASLIFHRPFDPDHRLFDPARGGGVLHDLGAYPLSLATFLFGPPVLESGRWHTAPTGVDIEAEMVLRCGTVPFAANVGFVEEPAAEGRNDFIIYGETGTLRIDRHFLGGPSLTLWNRPLENAPDPRGWGEKLARRLPLPGRTRMDFARLSRGLNFQAAAVQAAIARGETAHPSMPLSDSAAVLAIIEQVLATPPEG
ncbi:MAG: Gfo/Idh/MocA family oxidoreductase [Phyllobacteriaceae bacterium]|jgi:predicted dehydrogenase|nr:Gfo/Idh/MocA family oxidoreductase [Phyllobacteriaceae bacterium]